MKEVFESPPPELEENRLLEEASELKSIWDSRLRGCGIDFYVPNKMQLKAHESLAKTIVYTGGNRSGKSHFGAAELVMHLTKRYLDWYPRQKRYSSPIRAVISATSFAIVSRVIEPKLVSLLPQDSYYLKRTPQGYLSHIKIVDGSTVDVLTLEMDDMAYESADWDFAWLDEPQHRRKWVALKRGLVDRGGRIVISMTPLTQPWMLEDIVNKADNKRIAVFKADIRDNREDVNGTPILREENIQEFESSVPEEYKDARLHGEFFCMQGIVYRMFGDEHIKDFEYDGRSPVIGVLDPHDRLAHHMIWAWVDKNDDIWVDSELIVHCELPDLAVKIKAHEKEMKYRMRKRSIDPNFGRKPAASGSNHSVIQELSRNGIRFYEPCDDVELGHMIVRDYLNFDRSKPVTAINCPKLFFSRDRTSVTIRSMRNLQYEDWHGKTKDEKNPKEIEKEKDNHGADTIRYLLIEKPKYSNVMDSEELVCAPY